MRNTDSTHGVLLLIAVLISWLPSGAHSGSLVDDAFNLLSGGEYHRAYQRSKAKVERDIARENAKLQDALKNIDLDTAESRLEILKSQYEVTQLNYDRVSRVVSLHEALLKDLEEVVLARLKADQGIQGAAEHSHDLNETYELLTSVDRVPFDRDYLTNIQDKWWESMEKLQALAESRRQSISDVLQGTYAELDSESLEGLHASMVKFSQTVSQLVEFYGAQRTMFAVQFNTELKKARALGSKTKYDELPVD